jgi:hypothetical protein
MDCRVNALAQRLAASGHTVRVAIPDGPDKYDWNDALRSGTNLAALRNAILQSERVEPPREVLGLSVEDFMALDFPDRAYLLRPWLPSGGLVMIHAQRGTVKTFFALSAAYAVATGQAFLDWECERKGRVLYIDGELPGKLLQTRLALLGDHADDMFVLSREQSRPNCRPRERRGRIIRSLGISPALETRCPEATALAGSRSGAGR